MQCQHSLVAKINWLKFKALKPYTLLLIRLESTLQFQIMGGGAGEGDRNKRGGGPTDHLNINKRGSPNKRGGPEKCSRSEVATRYH